MPPCEYFTLFYIQCGVYTEFGIEPGNPSFRCETRDLLTDYLILLLLVYQKAAKRTLSHLGHRQRQQ